jgi:trehalose 2-sulfotransferase
MSVVPPDPKDSFAKVAFNIMRFRADMEKPACTKSYQIFFTPRSGSSWLTGVLSSTKLLGDPGEYFNPNFLLPNARAFNANSLARYIAMLKRRRVKGQTFGFEITYLQLLKTFGSEKNYYSHFGPDVASFYLVRKDIVKQAISLWKMVDTKVSHSVQIQKTDIHNADQMLRYDQHEIKRWLLHIHQQELGLNRFFPLYGYQPVRLYYEDMMAAGATRVAGDFMETLGVAGSPSGPVKASHEKVGSQLNDDFAERFSREEAEFLKLIEDERNTLHDF